MTTIVVDDAASLPVSEVLRQASGNIVELRSPTGNLIATVLMASDLDHEYAELAAYAEANLADLKRLADTPREQCATTAEVLARARAAE